MFLDDILLEQEELEISTESEEDVDDIDDLDLEEAALCIEDSSLIDAIYEDTEEDIDDEEDIDIEECDK